jgi:hypothetical protein
LKIPSGNLCENRGFLMPKTGSFSGLFFDVQKKCKKRLVKRNIWTFLWYNLDVFSGSEKGCFRDKNQNRFHYPPAAAEN